LFGPPTLLAREEDGLRAPPPTTTSTREEEKTGELLGRGAGHTRVRAARLCDAADGSKTLDQPAPFC
jgi:hypothetical protein